MSQIVLGIGEYGASKTPGAAVKTYALGSCVAAIFLCPSTRTVGMIHIALPDSSINPAKAKERPGYFADTGIPLLLKEMARLGCAANGRGMHVKLTGGASIMDPNETFNIGKRNVLTIRKILWSLGLCAVAEEIGGTISRTVSASVSSGEIVISTPGRPDKKL